VVYETPPSRNKQFCSAACANRAKQTYTMVPCLICGKLTKSHPSRPRRYCGKAHARTAANLTDANPSKHRDISGEKNPMYGKPGMQGPANPMWGRRGELAPRWKGGVRQRPDGYRRVHAPEGHPHPSEIDHGVAWILEHRLVMEGLLGRYLLPEEVVHHIDGDPSNNTPANLRLYANQAEHNRLGHPREKAAHPSSPLG